MMSQIDINRAMVRGARGLLDWTQLELSDRSSVSLSTVRDFERGARQTERESLMKLFDAFQKNGITFRQTGKTIAVERSL